MRPVIRGTRHACVAGHYLAAHAAFAILEAGGNAVDAGVAAVITESVVQSEQVSFAGIAPMMIYLADTGQVVTIPGVGTWPRAASCEFLEKEHGGHVPRGVLRSVVPAAPAAWILALQRYGTLSFADVSSAATRLARDGYPIHHYNAEQIRRNAADYREWPQNAAIYLPGGAAPAPGDRFVQADLAATLAHLADVERAAARGGRVAALEAVSEEFYRGEIARRIADFHREQGGWLSREDLADFAVEVEAPVRGTYGDREILTCGFWTQGPALIQMLNILESFGPIDAAHNSPRYLHRLVEVVKLAFADRHHHYADPRMHDVPADGLLSKEYARIRAGLVSEDRAWPRMPPPGDPRGMAALAREPARLADDFPISEPGAGLDTTYCCAVDSHGNVFSATPSDTSSDTPIIPGMGFCASARGTQAWGTRSNVNCVAPGKRPRVTPNPVMIFAEGRPAIAMGTPGGDVQPQAVLQVLLNMVEFGMDPQVAVEAARFVSWSFPNSREPHDHHAGLLALESRVDASTGEALAALGHRVNWWPDRTGRAGAVCVVRFDRERGSHEAAADFRRAGYALGW